LWWLFWLQSTNTLPVRWSRRMTAVTSPGRTRSSSSATASAKAAHRSCVWGVFSGT
jgi:hypothetical protein